MPRRARQLSSTGIFEQRTVPCFTLCFKRGLDNCFMKQGRVHGKTIKYWKPVFPAKKLIKTLAF
jgi:hypothetical protein